MENAILATEIFGMINLAIIFYGVWFESKDRSEKGKVFAVLLAAVFFNLFIDAVSYFPIDWERFYKIHFVITLIAFVTPFFVYAIFLQYVYLHVSQKAQTTKKLFIAGSAYCGLGVVFSIYYGVAGKLFEFIDGTYIAGEYYDGYLLTYIVVLAYTLTVVALHVKKIGWHDAFAVSMFMIVPIIFVLINLAFNEMAFAVSSLSLSMLVINTMLQAERENALVANEAAATTRAHSDELTGLNNRHAFSECFDNFEKNCNVGVIFADLNGLKYTNDHYGHRAGDKLLCDFAEVLKEFFSVDDIFRISGDEFIVMVAKLSQPEFDEIFSKVKSRVAEFEFPIASVGQAYGGSHKLSRLIDMAEEEMYEDKKEFYEKYPLYSRS